MKVGRLMTDQFLPKSEERPQIRNHTPGKINTSKLFAKVITHLKKIIIQIYQLSIKLKLLI